MCSGYVCLPWHNKGGLFHMKPSSAAYMSATWCKWLAQRCGGLLIHHSLANLSRLHGINYAAN